MTSPDSKSWKFESHKNRHSGVFVFAIIQLRDTRKLFFFFRSAVLDEMGDWLSSTERLAYFSLFEASFSASIDFEEYINVSQAIASFYECPVCYSD